MRPCCLPLSCGCACWPAGLLADWLAGRLAGWLAGWLSHNIVIACRAYLFACLLASLIAWVASLWAAPRQPSGTLLACALLACLLECLLACLLAVLACCGCLLCFLDVFACCACLLWLLCLFACCARLLMLATRLYAVRPWVEVTAQVEGKRALLYVGGCRLQ